MSFKFAFVIPFVFLVGCTNVNKPYNFQMDYPVAAARLSLSGKVAANINCETKTVDIISDTSDGLFSRHIKQRINSICYGKTDSRRVEYSFNADRSPRTNMLATQPSRTLEI